MTGSNPWKYSPEWLVVIPNCPLKALIQAWHPIKKARAEYDPALAFFRMMKAQCQAVLSAVPGVSLRAISLINVWMRRFSFWFVILDRIAAILAVSISIAGMLS